MRLDCSVMDELLVDIRGDIQSLYKLKETVCQLDVVVSFSEVSLSGGFCRPTFGSELVVRDGRHPVLNRFSTQELTSNDIVFILKNDSLLNLGFPILN